MLKNQCFFNCWKGRTLPGWWAHWLVVWVVDRSPSPSPFIEMYDFPQIEMLKNYWFVNGFKGRSAGWLVLAGCLSGRLVHLTFTLHSNVWFLNSRNWNVKNHWFFNGFKGRNAGWLVGWLAGCLSGRLVHFTFTLHSNVWFSRGLNVEKLLVFQWF